MKKKQKTYKTYSYNDWLKELHENYNETKIDQQTLDNFTWFIGKSLGKKGYELDNIREVLEITDYEFVEKGHFIFIIHHVGNKYYDKIQNVDDRYIIEFLEGKGMRIIGQFTSTPVNTTVYDKSELDVYKSKYSFELNPEGTLIRIFKVTKKNGEHIVYYSPKKRFKFEGSKMDTSTTFKDMLTNALECIGMTPEKETEISKMYLHNKSLQAILIHPRNQLINKDTITPTLVHVATFNYNDWSKYELVRMKEDVNFTTNFPMLKKIGYAELHDYIFNKHKRINVIDNKGNKFVLTTAEIDKKYEIRGSTPQNIEVDFLGRFDKNQHDALLTILPPAYGDITKLPKLVRAKFTIMIFTVLMSFGKIVNESIDKKDSDPKYYRSTTLGDISKKKYDLIMTYCMDIWEAINLIYHEYDKEINRNSIEIIELPQLDDISSDDNGNVIYDEDQCPMSELKHILCVKGGILKDKFEKKIFDIVNNTQTRVMYTMLPEKTILF